jgi:hypothetical protein
VTDVRGMFDRDYLGSWNLVDSKGEKVDVTVTIAKVTPVHVGREVKKDGIVIKKPDKKPCLSFVGKELGMVCNKTNAKTIAGMYSNDTEKWVGKQITLYATTTKFGSDTVDAIRVRPTIPKGATK